jgi:ubiquinone/menaquinone biosynthesis C-methylase UbiE
LDEEMTSMLPISTEGLLATLRAAGEPTRLRILALLAEGERSVKDLTDLLGQSQPRISRHLKLLADAGLVARHREAGWAFFRLADEGPSGEIASDIVARLDRADPVLARDRARLEALRRAHSEAAAEYFREHAGQWDRLRSLHVKDDQIEAVMLRLLGEDTLGNIVDLGTGTGRILELFSKRAERGIGVDLSHDMLSYARSRLERAGLANFQVRHGDIYNMTLQDGIADAVIIHQVLHYLDEPERAVSEAARLLKPGGRLLIADFAPHGLEFLRSDHAHRRLGFARDQIADWMSAAGVDLVAHEEFPPDDPDAAEIGRLTVSVWLGRRAQAHTNTYRHAEEAA